MSLEALLKSFDEIEPDSNTTLFRNGIEGGILNFLIDFPAAGPDFLAQAQLTFFTGVPETYIFGAVKDYFQEFTTIPTRDVLWNLMARKLTADDPHLEIKALLDRGSNPRETDYIRESLNDWLRHKAYQQLYSDENIAAFWAGNYEQIHNVVEAAKNVGVAATTSQVSIDELLASADTEYDWLIEGALLRGQPCIVGGPSKVLKTSVDVDMAISLASGTKFLGKYQAKKSRVLYYSGESGRQAIGNQVKAIMRARGLTEADLEDRLLFDFQLPRLTRPSDLAAIRRAIIEGKIDVVYIDPLYMAMDNSTNATNVFAMGAVFGNVSRMMAECNATVVLLHHFNRKGSPNAKPTLADLSMAGAAEFARQHILISRRKAYEMNGRHDLHLVMGREGGCEYLNLVVNEGSQDDRRWEVELSAGKDSSSKRSDLETRMQTYVDDTVEAVTRMVAEGVTPTKNQLRDALGKSGGTMTEVLQRAIDLGLLEMNTSDGRTTFIPATGEQEDDE